LDRPEIEESAKESILYRKGYLKKNIRNTIESRMEEGVDGRYPRH
jgi:hypothetical protein